MGQDKALLPLAAGGPPMLAIVIGCLRQVAEDVTIVGGDQQQYGQFGTRIVPDRYPGGAALAGIRTAIEAAAHPHCLVVACDMPLLSVPLLTAMARERRDYDVLIPAVPGVSRQGTGGVVLQTLHAIYGKACAPAIDRQFENGKFQVVGFFDQVTVRTVPAGDISAIDPGMWSFFNANTPQALEEARGYWATLEPTP